MSTTGIFPFNDLPVELQREIFVVATILDPSNAIRLVFVARRVHAWVQPYIYEMVTLGSNDTALFLRTVNSMSPEFFANHVKKLCLSVSVSGRNATRILSVCTGVSDLAFWVDFINTFSNRSIVPFISSLPLRRLSIEFKHFLSLFPDPETRHTWCDTLTHLDIIFWTFETSPVIPNLDKLSSLTHLAMRLRHNQAHETALSNILLACKSLEVLIIFDETDTVEATVWPTDPRVVYLPYPPNVIREWEAQAQRDDTCSWIRAEDLVRRHAAERERANST